MKRHVSFLAMVGIAAAAMACGGGSGYGSSSTSAPSSGNPSTAPDGTATPASSTPNAAPAGFVITIQNMGFSPLNLAVPAGATVTVVNLDGMPHSVTSEARSGSYTRGAPAGLAPFDTGDFSSGQRTFTVPANAPPGTVIPYYCTVHTNTMTTPNGTITVDPNASPTGAPTPPSASPSMGY